MEMPDILNEKPQPTSKSVDTSSGMPDILSESPASPTPAPVADAPVTFTNTDAVTPKPTFLSKVGGVLKSATKSTLDWWNKQQQENEIAQFEMRQMMYGKNNTIVKDPVTGKNKMTNPVLDAYKNAQTPEEKAKIIADDVKEIPLIKALNSETGKKITKTISDKTSNLGVKAYASLIAMGDKTYDEAYQEIDKDWGDPNNSRVGRILYQAQNSGLQSLVGALLSIGASYASRNPKVGQVVGTTYFGAISAEEERQKYEGGNIDKTSSLGNIAIDTVGDQLIGNFGEKVLEKVGKEGAESVLKSMGKGFLVEGTTEPVQSLMKYGNDYTSARTDAEKQKVVADFSNYVKSGAMLDEFLVGGIAGSAITGLAHAGGQAVNFVSDKSGKSLSGGDIDRIEEDKKDEVQTAVENGDISGVVQDIADQNNLDIENATRIVQQIVTNAMIDNSPETSGNVEQTNALLEDIKTAINNGSRVSAISSAIQDQYNVSAEYADNKVAEALASINEPKMEQAPVVENPEAQKPTETKVNKPTADEKLADEKTTKKVVKENAEPETLNAQILNTETNTVESTPVTPVGYGQIGSREVFVAPNATGGFSVYNKATGEHLGDSNYKSPKRIISHVETQLAEKSKEKLAKVGRKKAKTSKDVISNIKTIQKYDKENKTTHTIEEVTRAVENGINFSDEEIASLDNTLEQEERELINQIADEYKNLDIEALPKDAKPEEIEALVEEVVSKYAEYNITKNLTLDMPAYLGKWGTTKVSLSVDSFGQIFIDGEMRGTFQDLKENEDNSKVAQYLSDEKDAYLFDDNQNTVLEDIENAYNQAKAEGDAILLDNYNKVFGEPKTQKQKVQEAIKNKAKTIKEIADETKILEPNVRRILGVGAKEGVFTRKDKGVYILSKDGVDTAYIHTGDAVETLPKLADDGLKADMVFLDIPYDTPAVKGGNRGVNYNLISVEQFAKVLDATKKILKDLNSPVIHMYSQAESGLKAMTKYNDLFLEKGFVPVAKGEYQKTFADGSPVTSPNGKVAKPEGILVFTQSGTLKKDIKGLNFTLKRPKGYQTEKPAEMLKAMIEMTTEQGDTVLDPFAGSGVTGAEAIRAGRKAVLIEKDAKVAEEITKTRVEEALKEVATAEKVVENAPVYAKDEAKTALKEAKNNVKDIEIINDEKLSVEEKINTLLDIKQTGKEYKDVGERVSGSKKERATIKAIYKYGNQEMLDEVMQKLGWESVLETVDKSEIFENTGAKDTIQSDYDNKVPASIAKAKRDLLDSIYKVPKLGGKKSGKYSWSHYVYKTDGTGRFNIALSKDSLVDVAKVYPTTLKQLVEKILSINSGVMPTEIATGAIAIDIGGNIVDKNSPEAFYAIDRRAFGFSDTWDKRPAYIIEKAGRDAKFNGEDYAGLLNPEKKEKKQIDTRHGNFEAIDKYDITDEDIAREKVTADNLVKDYGFKSVQLGNYMDDASSFEHIQQTMGAIESMSKSLGIDLKKIISKRGLSVAFGARGGGKALAHYEPSANIINMTKKRGDGSFGHEFMHFLDFTATTKKGVKVSSLYSPTARRYYTADKAGMDLMSTIINGGYATEKSFSPKKTAEETLKNFYYNMGIKKEVDVQKATDYIKSEYEKDPNGIVGKPIYYTKDDGFSITREESVDFPYSNYYVKLDPQTLSNVVGKEIKATVTLTTSDFKKNADDKLGGGYWSRNEELLARAFQAYIQDKMEATGNQNTYATRDTLSNTDVSFNAFAYPQGQEREIFSKAFDTYFDTLKSEFPLDDTMYKTSKTITLYRGMSREFDVKYDTNNTDAPNGYSTWTDNVELAKQYAGKNGYVYEITLPTNEQTNEIVDADGERGLFFDNEKKAGLNGISGKEYLVYTHHDNYSPDLVKKYEPKNYYKYKGEVLNVGGDTVSGAFLKDASERLKVNFDWQFFDKIYGQAGVPAWGVTRQNAIGLQFDAPFTTEHHELVHLTIKNLQSIDALKHLNKDDILIEQTKKMGLPIEKYTTKEVEEALANDFEDYYKGKSVKFAKDSKIKQLFDFLKEQLQKIAQAIKLSKGSLIEEYYDILLSGRSTTNEFVDLSNGREFTGFVRWNTLDFSKHASPEATLRTNFVMMKEKLDTAIDEVNALVQKIQDNKEMMSFVSKYADKASVDVIAERANNEVADYVQAVLEIENIKKNITDASETFQKLVAQREAIEDMQNALDSKIRVIVFKTNNTKKRTIKPTVTTVADAIAVQTNDNGDAGEKVVITPSEALAPAETEKTKKKTKGTSSFQHRMLDLLDEAHRDDVTYNRMQKIQEVAKAEMYYDENKKRTIDIAMGKEDTPEGISANVIALTVIQKAKEAGDIKTIAKVLPKLSLRATKQGQEISMLRDAFGDKDPIAYMNKLIAQRKLLAKKKYKPFFTKLDDAKNFETLVKEKKENARKKAPKLSELMTIKAQQIDDFLSEITC